MTLPQRQVVEGWRGIELRRAVAQSLARPYPVTWPMVALMALVPVYLVIANRAQRGVVYAPELAFDRALPLVPAWALVYGLFYLYLIVLPVFVVRDVPHVRRTFFAYLAVWISAYIVFLVYPTVAPRPAVVAGDGFAVWGLRFLYGADPPYNCFPSLHVAHSFVSAFTCRRVHRGVGRAALVCAALVAMSTMLTKQHYVVDVIAGITMAAAATTAALWTYPAERVPEHDRQAAPQLALALMGLVGIILGATWVAVRLVV